MGKGGGLPWVVGVILAGGAVLGLGALGAGGAGVQGRVGQGCPAPGGPAGKETVMGYDAGAGDTARARVPPLDTQAPEHTETAVFGLG